jgi:hypothetical protein
MVPPGIPDRAHRVEKPHLFNAVFLLRNSLHGRVPQEYLQRDLLSPTHDSSLNWDEDGGGPKTSMAGLSGNHTGEMTESIAQEWLRVQRLICAHKRRRDRDQRANDLLNWGTVVAAVITAASTSFREYPAATVLAGILTAALAAFERVFAPTKNIQSLWKTQRSLETSQHELLTLLHSLPVQKGIIDAQRALAHIADNANNSISIPVSDNDKDRGEAERDFRGTVLYLRRTEGTSPPNQGADHTIADTVMGDDALNVIAVTRRRRV